MKCEVHNLHVHVVTPTSEVGVVLATEISSLTLGKLEKLVLNDVSWLDLGALQQTLIPPTS